MLILFATANIIGITNPPSACAWSVKDVVSSIVTKVSDYLKDPGCWNNSLYTFVRTYLNGEIVFSEFLKKLGILYQQYGKDRCLRADPVDVVISAYTYRRKDFSIQSPGIDLIPERYYHSQDSYDGPFGIGWNHSFNYHLYEVRDNACRAGDVQK